METNGSMWYFTDAASHPTSWCTPGCLAGSDQTLGWRQFSCFSCPDGTFANPISLTKGVFFKQAAAGYRTYWGREITRGLTSSICASAAVQRWTERASVYIMSSYFWRTVSRHTRTTLTQNQPQKSSLHPCEWTSLCDVDMFLFAWESRWPGG